MSKEDFGPIAQYNSLTDPYLQGYFSKNIIRNHLKQSGLISRRGDIIPEEVWRKRIATKDKMQQASRLIASKIVQQAIELKNLEQAEFRRKLDEIAKKELVRRIRGQSANPRELPLLWPNNRVYSEEKLGTRSRSRSPRVYEEATFIEDSQSFTNYQNGQHRRTGQKHGSKRLSSKKRLTKLNRGYALLPKPEPTPVMVTMYYYGKSINIPFDTQVFEYRDEITIYQQHCGGENLLVYSGLHQAGDKFEFRSKRHKEYPFSLTIYINSTYDSRISTCCEYKHQLNVKIGGKGGRFAITNVTGSEPCIKCLLEKSEKDAKQRKEREAKQKENLTKVDDIQVDTEQTGESGKSLNFEATEIEVKHEEDKNENYVDEWLKDDDNNIDEESKSHQSKIDSDNTVKSVADEEIKKVKIPVKHDEDEVTDESSESKTKSPTASRRKSSNLSTDLAKEQPARYSSNDFAGKIEKDVDIKKQAQKSSTDNTSEDESSLDSARDKIKTLSQKGSKASSRAESAKSKSSANESFSPDENDSDTENLLNRIKSGRRSKPESPQQKPKTPSQNGSRNASPSTRLAKSPSLKSPKWSNPSTPDQIDSEKKSKKDSPSVTNSQKGSRNSSPARSKQSSPTKTASKPTSPSGDKASRKSSTGSLKTAENQDIRAKKSPSPSKIITSPKNELFSSTDDLSSEGSLNLANSGNKGEIAQLNNKPNANLPNETNNVVVDTNPRDSPTKNSNLLPDLINSPNGSRHSPIQQNQRSSSSASKKSEEKIDLTKQPSRAGSSASKKSSRPPSENEKKEELINDRPSSSSSKKSQEKTDLMKQPSRAGSSASKNSSRPSSKNSITNEKPIIPELNVIPSSDVEKNSNESFNDETKWYKDDSQIQS